MQGCRGISTNNNPSYTIIGCGSIVRFGIRVAIILTCRSCGSTDLPFCPQSPTLAVIGKIIPEVGGKVVVNNGGRDRVRSTDSVAGGGGNCGDDGFTWITQEVIYGGQSDGSCGGKCREGGLA